MRLDENMDFGLEIIDFHTHFPTSRPWFDGMGPDIVKQYIDRRGERRANILREQSRAYSREWQMTWGFDPPESDPPDDKTQAEETLAGQDVQNNQTSTTRSMIY